MIPGSPPEFSSTAHRPEENETALQTRTLANEADFFEQAPSRILPFLKPLRQTPCYRTVVLAAATVSPANFHGSAAGGQRQGFQSGISILLLQFVVPFRANIVALAFRSSSEAGTLT